MAFDGSFACVICCLQFCSLQSESIVHDTIDVHQLVIMPLFRNFTKPSVIILSTSLKRFKIRLVAHCATDNANFTRWLSPR